MSDGTHFPRSIQGRWEGGGAALGQGPACGLWYAKEGPKTGRTRGLRAHFPLQSAHDRVNATFLTTKTVVPNREYDGGSQSVDTAQRGGGGWKQCASAHTRTEAGDGPKKVQPKKTGLRTHKGPWTGSGTDIDTHMGGRKAHRPAPPGTAPRRTAPPCTALPRTAPPRTAPHRPAPHGPALHHPAPPRPAPPRRVPPRRATHRTAPHPHRGDALTPGNVALHCRSCTAHCPQAVRQCIAGVAAPTAPRQWGRALQELHCPLPQGSEAVHCKSSTAHCPQAVRQCVAGVPLPTALCPQLQCSRAHTVQCRAQHQAVRHHRESTDGAARHTQCSGPTRPCVTGNRRRQSNTGQVRLAKCDCALVQLCNNTLAHSAHLDTQPSRLPVPVGRHPGHCLLVTAPSAHRTAPHRTTPHHTTPHHTAPHRTAPHRTTPHHTAPHHTTPHHTTIATSSATSRRTAWTTSLR